MSHPNDGDYMFEDWDLSELPMLDLGPQEANQPQEITMQAMGSQATQPTQAFPMQEMAPPAIQFPQVYVDEQGKRYVHLGRPQNDDQQAQGDLIPLKTEWLMLQGNDTNQDVVHPSEFQDIHEWLDSMRHLMGPTSPNAGQLQFSTFAEARDWNTRIITEPELPVEEDETIWAVLKQREVWVGKLHDAIVNLDGENAREEPSDRNQFDLQAIDPLDTEATAFSVFGAVVDRAINGYRGGRADYFAKMRGSREDVGMNCETRITHVEEVLKNNKLICKDILKDPSRILDLAHCPHGVAWKKVDNAKNNAIKKKTHETYASDAAKLRRETLEDGTPNPQKPRGRKPEQPAESPVENLMENPVQDPIQDPVEEEDAAPAISKRLTRARKCKNPVQDSVEEADVATTTLEDAPVAPKKRKYTRKAKKPVEGPAEDLFMGTNTATTAPNPQQRPQSQAATLLAPNPNLPTHRLQKRARENDNSGGTPSPGPKRRQLRSTGRRGQQGPTGSTMLPPGPIDIYQDFEFNEQEARPQRMHAVGDTGAPPVSGHLEVFEEPLEDKLLRYALNYYEQPTPNPLPQTPLAGPAAGFVFNPQLINPQLFDAQPFDRQLAEPPADESHQSPGKVEYFPEDEFDWDQTGIVIEGEKQSPPAEGGQSNSLEDAIEDYPQG
ncbi:hypothetical protein EJ04DRAFT_605229 [Polyplosphaeria fusca]|uniref:Uncharacterized protein n=1 Tax=Polyplosphaeria fusca TaxID=682080 RepID=A0A9P4QTQ0_9PLEO|nr:hypothetical protein EJ04DRAFT_605229 [Polyplosphaeria fusca]